jgi:tRNA dimethylallyltransferase
MSLVNPDQHPRQTVSKENGLDNRPPLVVILGPTAVGKTEIALKLAMRLKAEIISADSRLFYLGMDIGTAKPSIADRKLVTHHLVDVVEPDQPWSLADFQKAARLAISTTQARRNLPLLVGGTGQYIRAIIQAWEVPKVLPNPHLRDALENWAVQITPEGLHERLATLDPDAAEQIDPRNLRRTIRALEVILSTGVRFSDQRQQTSSPYRLLLLGLHRSRAELYQRIDQRINAMLAAGFVIEVQALLDRGYSPELPAFSAIGYREIIAYLHGKLTLEEAVARMRRQTRIFVRRQANWFKQTDPNIHWFEVNPETVDGIESLIRDWLNGSPIFNSERASVNHIPNSRSLHKEF